MPKIPTANSAHMRNKASRMMSKITVLNVPVFKFLITSSMARPVLNKRVPATMKSVKSHFTSLVNCMAISGMLKINATTPRIIAILVAGELNVDCRFFMILNLI
ncbi:hypothetical protein D3C85_1262080 [compost metagenome]